MAAPDDPLIYAHIGDLHLTEAGLDNHRDLQSIVAEIARELSGQIDFVYLPGDNADNGTPAQYALVKDAIAPLPMPVHIITGDHDMEPGGLDNFYRCLAAPKLPKVVETSGIRCLFLDICGPGTGGPDFRVGIGQTNWLVHQLDDAAKADKRCAIFMHSYPDDLKGNGETAAINAAFEAREVVLVDMGHTHYNELANDGRTIFAATRSTGQIEEGPVGYAVVAIDRRTVSWRFKTLTDTFPLVLITAPADRRLANDADDADHVPGESCEIRVSVLGRSAIARCVYRIDDGPSVEMAPAGGGRFTARAPLSTTARRLTVVATDADGRTGHETIECARAAHLDTYRHADGSDKDAVDPWEERGIFGTQLGPNRNGRPW